MKHRTDPMDAGWQTQYVDSGYFIRLVRRQLLPLLLAPVLCLALGFIYLVVTLPTYNSSALLNVDVGATQPEALDATLVSHMEAIRSNAVTSEVIERLGMAEGMTVSMGTLDTIISKLRSMLGIYVRTEISEEEKNTAIQEWIASALEVYRVEDSTLIRVGYYAADPIEAADIANAYVDVYIEQLVQNSTESTARRAEFLRSRIEEVKQEAVSSYQEMQEIRSRDGLELNDFENPDVRAASLREEFTQIEQSEASITTRLSLMEDTSDMDALEAAAFQAEGGPALFYALRDATETLARLQERGVAPNYVAQLEASVTDLRTDLEQLLDQERRGLELDLAILEARRQNVAGSFDREQLQSNLKNWSEIRIAEHQAGVFQNIYADHLRELEVVYGRSGVVPVRLMARARPNVEPVAPDYKLTLIMAAMIGLVIGAAIALFREWQTSQVAMVLDRRHRVVR